MEIAVMKKLLFVVAALALASSAYLVRAADMQDRPPGVDAKSWVVVSKDLGLVIAPAPETPAPLQQPPGQARDQPLLLVPPAHGYFMARMGDGSWRRVVIIEPIKGPGSAG
jgi:hypothetical protein